MDPRAAQKQIILRFLKTGCREKILKVHIVHTHAHTDKASNSLSSEHARKDRNAFPTCQS